MHVFIFPGRVPRDGDGVADDEGVELRHSHVQVSPSISGESQFFIEILHTNGLGTRSLKMLNGKGYAIHNHLASVPTYRIG